MCVFFFWARELRFHWFPSFLTYLSVRIAVDVVGFAIAKGFVLAPCCGYRCERVAFSCSFLGGTDIPYWHIFLCS